MIHNVLKIGDWIVDFLFTVSRYDEEGILACLYDMDAPYDVMVRANRIMERNNPNCGFTYTNPRMKRALVVIGHTTSGAEYINTLVHEVYHLTVAIASERGDDLEGEVPAYIAGDTVDRLADVVCKMGCHT